MYFGHVYIFKKFKKKSRFLNLSKKKKKKGKISNEKVFGLGALGP